MIVHTRTLELYSCVCDNCQEAIPFADGDTEFTDENLSDWMNFVHTDAFEIIDKKHICYKCLTHDDDGNETIDLTRTKPQQP